MRPSRDEKFWFRAKPHGWGYGPPTCWQGWAVIVVYLLLLVAGVVPAFVAYGWGLRGYLILVGLVTLGTFGFVACMHKGPRLRWRNDDNDTGDYPLGTCQRCGYDLTGNESGVCPECGTERADG